MENHPQLIKNSAMTAQKIASKLITSLSFFSLLFIQNLHCQEAPTWRNAPETKILSNGLLLIYQEDESSAITVAQILIKGGKRTEPNGKKGLSYLTTRITLEIPDRGKVQDIMSQATRIFMTSKDDYSLVNVACLSENLEDTFDLISKIMRKPLFSGLRIGNIKKMMNRQRDAQEDDSINVAHKTLLDNLFEGTAYSGSAFGSEDSLKAIKKKDVENFFKDHFIAENMVIAVSSDLDKESVFKLLEKYFGKFPSGEPPEPEAQSFYKPKKNHIFKEKDSKQSLVSMAFPLPAVSSRNYILAHMLDYLLGKGPNSRLWPLRAEEKLAYNVNSRITQFREGGILEAYLETDKAKEEVAVEALKKILNDLHANGITEEELSTTKTLSKASFLRDNETKENRVRSLVTFEALGLGYNFFEKFFQEINGTTLEEMNAFIKEILNPEKGIQVVVGPKTKQK